MPRLATASRKPPPIRRPRWARAAGRAEARTVAIPARKTQPAASIHQPTTSRYGAAARNSGASSRTSR